MWGVRTKVIRIVVGGLGTIPLSLKENLWTIGVDTSIELIQRSILTLESARILRIVLEMKAGEERTLLGFLRQLFVARNQ